MKSGVKASSARFVSVGARRLSPPRNEMPWSAVTTTSALSHRPVALAACQEAAEQAVGVAELEEMALPGLEREAVVRPELADAAGRARARDGLTFPSGK